MAEAVVALHASGQLLPPFISSSQLSTDPRVEPLHVLAPLWHPACSRLRRGLPLEKDRTSSEYGRTKWGDPGISRINGDECFRRRCAATVQPLVARSHAGSHSEQAWATTPGAESARPAAHKRGEQRIPSGGARKGCGGGAGLERTSARRCQGTESSTAAGATCGARTSGRHISPGPVTINKFPYIEEYIYCYWVL